MPLYDFKCGDCGNIFDELVISIDGYARVPNRDTSTRALVTTCPKCNGVSNRVVNSVQPPIFKGGKPT